MPVTHYRVVACDGTVLKGGFEFMTTAELWVLESRVVGEPTVEPYLPGEDEQAPTTEALLAFVATANGFSVNHKDGAVEIFTEESQHVSAPTFEGALALAMDLAASPKCPKCGRWPVTEERTRVHCVCDRVVLATVAELVRIDVETTIANEGLRGTIDVNVFHNLPWRAMCRAAGTDTPECYEAGKHGDFVLAKARQEAAKTGRAFADCAREQLAAWESRQVAAEEAAAFHEQEDRKVRDVDGLYEPDA